MDRRMKKSRDAIRSAFMVLLKKKNYADITVGEIIELANVGRATFYAHFETKDYLLKELCAELFDHIFSHGEPSENNGLFALCTEEKDEPFLHLFKQIKNNENNIYRLLASSNNELFLDYFRHGAREVVLKNLDDFKSKKPEVLPQDFWVNHIVASLIETLRWWIENEMRQSPETITQYFLLSI